METQRQDDAPITEADIRKQTSLKLMKTNPGYLPVCIRHNSDTTQPQLNFMVPGDGSIGNILRHVRAKLKISASESIFLYCGNSVLPIQQSIAELYQRHHDSTDLRLYLFYAKENTFGFA